MPNFDQRGEIAANPLAVTDCQRLFAKVRHLHAFYPRFGDWFWGKVVPGLRDGTRLVVPEYVDGRLVAVAILKRTPEERKICTLWVAPFARRCRLGTRLVR